MKNYYCNTQLEHYGTAASCIADPNRLEDAPCGILNDPSGSYIRHSEGFCCACTIDQVLNAKKNRGGVDCGDILAAMQQSFHCLRPDKLWY